MSNGPEYIRDQSLIETGAPRTPVGGTPVVPVARVADPYDARIVAVQQVPVAPVVTGVTVAAQHAAAVRTAYTRRFAPDAIIAAVLGLVIVLVGLLAITRGGFDGPMDTPVVGVLGFTHTTLLGLIEIVIGGCLLISGATQSRSGALFFGSVLGIGAFVGAVQTESFDKNLALESGWAWLMLFAAVIVVLTALLLPRFVTRSTSVERF